MQILRCHLIKPREIHFQNIQDFLSKIYEMEDIEKIPIICNFKTENNSYAISK